MIKKSIPNPAHPELTVLGVSLREEYVDSILLTSAGRRIFRRVMTVRGEDITFAALEWLICAALADIRKEGYAPSVLCFSLPFALIRKYEDSFFSQGEGKSSNNSAVGLRFFSTALQLRLSCFCIVQEKLESIIYAEDAPCLSADLDVDKESVILRYCAGMFQNSGEQEQAVLKLGSSSHSSYREALGCLRDIARGMGLQHSIVSENKIIREGINSETQQSRTGTRGKTTPAIWCRPPLREAAAAAFGAARKALDLFRGVQDVPDLLRPLLP